MGWQLPQVLGAKHGATTVALASAAACAACAACYSVAPNVDEYRKKIAEKREARSLFASFDRDQNGRVTIRSATLSGLFESIFRI
eukprot:COSAG05_NODE_317_length_11545_cov_73.981391_9_plen_85_part_00